MMTQKLRNINNQPHLKAFRRKLRSNLTPAEATLWLALKNKQVEGRRFRRQFSVGNYILDFYCPVEKLAIELDGQLHFTDSGFEKDFQRDQYLADKGIKVLRFENEVVFQNLEGIITTIIKSFKTPLDSPSKGESSVTNQVTTTSPLQGEKERG